MRLAGLAKFSLPALLRLSLSFLVKRREALAFLTPLAVTFIDQRNRMGVLPPRTERRNPALVAPRRGFAVGSLEPIAAAYVSTSPAALVHCEFVATGCITLFTTYSPILSPISVPARVEKR